MFIFLSPFFFPKIQVPIRYLKLEKEVGHDGFVSHFKLLGASAVLNMLPFFVDDLDMKKTSCLRYIGDHTTQPFWGQIIHYKDPY